MASCCSCPQLGSSLGGWLKLAVAAGGILVACCGSALGGPPGAPLGAPVGGPPYVQGSDTGLRLAAVAAERRSSSSSSSRLGAADSLVAVAGRSRRKEVEEEIEKPFELARGHNRQQPEGFSVGLSGNKRTAVGLFLVLCGLVLTGNKQ
ncbi:hypothetical protein, conserved [Eimeria tenella]|uniref:Uncharacterized protein n=1 Tax=Eimeria tenella TaxID=5802 RepID=U6L005_EIMTE|nr:hypothetical protein, conserved [Eimeria tenella]CDJ43757.1 hypothetical protein, conserved [Eimeria tenella]|eukprot:XP_013234506.1 hypothetical protein, conserved [Eimeria tenella]